MLNFDNGKGDIIGTDCKSVIGDLTGLWASSKKVGGASFKLQTQCKILGNTVDLGFNKNEQLLVTVIKDSSEGIVQNCTGPSSMCDSEGNCSAIPSRTSDTITTYTYFSGKFQKSK